MKIRTGLLAVVMLAALAAPLLPAPQGKKKPAPKPPPRICLREKEPGDGNCPCLRYHPDLCLTDEPLPYCCRVAEGKADVCGCCSHRQ